MNYEAKSYLRNISTIILAFVQSSRLAEKDVCFITAATLSLPLDLYSAQTLFICFIKCVFVCASSGGQTWEDVCGSKQGYVCVCVCGLAFCIIKHQQQRCGGQMQTDRIKQCCGGHGPYDLHRLLQYASLNSCLHICPSLSAALISLSLQSQWYYQG